MVEDACEGLAHDDGEHGVVEEEDVAEDDLEKEEGSEDSEESGSL